jgi:phosphoadenosine phosphosulfate reductase
MLVDSPHLLPQDREDWERRYGYDLRLGAGRGLADRAARAREEIEAWARGRDIVPVSVSWGKDSTVVAHLALTSRIADRVRLTYVRQRWYHSPEAIDVRDAFLAEYPATYEEIVFPATSPRRWDIDGNTTLKPHRYTWPNNIRITGVRAAESKIRRQSAYWHGISTDMTCRPILWWPTIDVFAYLAHHRLPTHPAYAMTTLATQQREYLRVAPLGGIPGGDQRAGWEDAYYGKHLLTVRSRITVLRAAQPSYEPVETIIGRALAGFGGGSFWQGKPLKPSRFDMGLAIQWLVSEGHLATTGKIVRRIPEHDVPLSPGIECGDLK